MEDDGLRLCGFGFVVCWAMVTKSYQTPEMKTKTYDEKVKESTSVEKVIRLFTGGHLHLAGNYHYDRFEGKFA
jgi:uncharacterized phosphosugar-binding protein